ECGGPAPMISGQAGMNDGGDFVVRTMKGKNASQFDVRGPRPAYLALDLGRAKGYIGIFRGLQNFLMHALVARCVSTLTARCVDHNLAASDTSSRIEMHRPAVQGERAVYGVKSAVDIPMHFGLCGIQREDDFRKWRWRVGRRCGLGASRRRFDEQR